MPKRLVDSDIWKKQRWFRKLSPIYKLAFLYLKDQCDHCGMWTVSVLDLIDDLGIEDFDINDFVEKVNKDYEPTTGVQKGRERLITLSKGSEGLQRASKGSEGYVWITGFCNFQYAGKDHKIYPASASNSAICMLIGHGLINEAIEKGFVTLSNPIEAFERGKDKYKDKYNNTQDKTLHNKLDYGDKFSKNGNGSTNSASGKYDPFAGLGTPKPEIKQN